MLGFVLDLGVMEDLGRVLDLDPGFKESVLLGGRGGFFRADTEATGVGLVPFVIVGVGL